MERMDLIRKIAGAHGLRGRSPPATDIPELEEAEPDDPEELQSLFTWKGWIEPENDNTLT